MSRLFFLYYSHGSNADTPFNILDLPKSDNRWAKQFATDGLYKIFQRLLSEKVVDEIHIVTESARGPGRIDTGIRNLFSLVIPHIRHLDCILDSNSDIIITRGGFRHWHDWLANKQKLGFWMTLYAANTGRQRWPWWDVVLDDVDPSFWGRQDPKERFHVDYRKPVNPDFFFGPKNKKDYVYDVMLGASHITDRKGQWRAWEAVKAAKKLGRSLKCVMPGAVRGSAHTNKMMAELHNFGIEVHCPGEVDRGRLGELMRASRLFVHAGAAGQNDRGPIEALACGCQIVLNAPQYHHPAIAEASNVIDCTDRLGLAEFLIQYSNYNEEIWVKLKEASLRLHKQSHNPDLTFRQLKFLLSYFQANERSNEAKEKLVQCYRNSRVLAS